MVTEMAREMRQAKFQATKVSRSARPWLTQCAIRVNLAALIPGIDVQCSESKRLVGGAMQMKLHNGQHIAVIDEIELGLELALAPTLN